MGESVQGYNLFTYCFNNPVNLSDETGHWPQWLKDIGNAAKNILVKIANTTQAVFSAASAYIGGGVGVGASVQTTIGSLPVEVSAVAKTDIVSAEIGEGKIFHGITDESSLGANIAGVGPVLGKKRQHSFGNSDNCICYPNESLIVRSLVINDCPEWKTKIDDNHIKFSLGFSAYFAFGISASVEYDFTYLYEEIIKIWRN